MKDLIRDLQVLLRKNNAEIFVNDSGYIRIDKFADIDDEEPLERAFLNQTFIDGGDLLELAIEPGDPAYN